MKNISDLKNQPVAAVGIIEAKTERKDELTNAEVGRIHEFGAPAANIPERSFLRSTVMEKQGEINSMLAKAEDQIVMKGMNPKTAIGRVAATAATWVKQKILSNIPPHTKPAGGKMLVDTGQLVNSVSWELRGKDGKK